MKKTIEYKGYIGEFDLDGYGGLYGRVIGLTKNILTFQGKNPDELQKDFEEMIDEYLKECKTDNIKPEVPFKGSFNVRVGTVRH